MEGIRKITMNTSSNMNAPKQPSAILCADIKIDIKFMVK